MSWFKDYKERSWLESHCIKILLCGPIPQHVAIIMDGNRRFAKKAGSRSMEGHVKGFEKLAETIQWLKDLGVTELTVYAFSIENFKRPEEEVNGLLDLAAQKFEKLLEEIDKFMKYGICVRVLGNLTLLPVELQKKIGKAVTMTRKNNGGFLNICFAYTSRDEITTAVREVTAGVEKGFLEPGDITEEVLEKCLYTYRSPNPDIVLRTSGEVRLSDFLLWQGSYSMLSFMKVLWPEFSIWHLFAAIFTYQLHYSRAQYYKRKCLEVREQLQKDEDLKRAESELIEGDNLDEKIQVVKQQREQRVRNFLNHVEKTRDEHIESLWVK